MTQLLLDALMFFTGLVDSVAGGGGLISLPALSWALSPGVPAVATNKIIGASGVLVAAIFYSNHSGRSVRESLHFIIAAGVGAWIGSQIAPRLPVSGFKITLMIVAPVILLFLWNKDRWLRSEGIGGASKPKLIQVFVGFCVGAYDGAFGPGGGTLMLLSIIYFRRIPIIDAIAASKFSNLVTATTSLVGYGLAGHVNWAVGLRGAVFMVIGTLIGVNLAIRYLDKVMKIALAIVATLLIGKMFWGTH